MVIKIALSLSQIRNMTDVALRVVAPDCNELTRTRIEIELSRREGARPKIR